MHQFIKWCRKLERKKWTLFLWMAHEWTLGLKQKPSLCESLKRKISRSRDVLHETCRDPATSEHGVLARHWLPIIHLPVGWVLAGNQQQFQSITSYPKYYLGSDGTHRYRDCPSCFWLLWKTEILIKANAHWDHKYTEVFCLASSQGWSSIFENIWKK